MVNTPDMAGIFAKSTSGLDSLTDEERLKLQAMYLAMFRRLESVFVQTELGSIDQKYVAGAELSLLSVINTPFGHEWWQSAKPIFYVPFVSYVESKLQSNQVPGEHPAIRTQVN